MNNQDTVKYNKIFVIIIIILTTPWILICSNLVEKTNTLLETKHSYESEVFELQELKNELQTEIESLYKSEEELLLKKSTLDAEIVELTDTLKKLEEQHSALESDIVNLNNEIKNLRAKIDSSTPVNKFDFIHLDGNVNKECIKIVNNEISLLSSKVIDLFRNNNARIYITTKNIAKEMFNGKYSSVQGVTLYGYDEIYIEDRVNACKNATLHECGHLFNEYAGYVAYTDEFRNIYMEEVNSFKILAGDYSAANMDECFAEAFMIYFKNRSGLTSYCPKISKYIEKLVQ